MEDSKELMQFDSLLGGHENLPHEVNVLKFAAARSKEIAAMTECILNPCTSKLVFQTLPVHMRRRIMSHNSKRLPRKLRQAHESQLLKSGLPSKQKRPSRKYRRRPKNLMEEYNRRQKEHVWLETHIWHAKRFHMTRKWGYKLPEAPCDKAFRACYRAGSKHCLLQDKSYYASIQLYGNLEELMSGFKRITSPKCGLGLTSQAYLNGKREGSAFIFNVDQYPFECVGKITFLWKSHTESEQCVWIFIHPSFYKEFLDILVKCYSLVMVKRDISSSAASLVTENGEKPAKRRKLQSITEDNIPDKINNTYINNRTIRLIELKDKVNRFSLTGPLSHAILRKALCPIEANGQIDLKSSKKLHWFQELCIKTPFKSLHETQSRFWSKFKNINSPAELPCRLIVGLNVKDPRTSFPTKRTKAVPGAQGLLEAKDFIMMPDDLNCSPLWDEGVRKNVSKKIKTNLEINKLRETTSLVPGSNSVLLENIPGVPIILLQRPGSQTSEYKRIGYNSGWDIIIPAGYGMAFWMSFILRGARVGGLRESVKLAFESGSSDLHPDMAACQSEDLKHCDFLRDKYFRLPPNKRANYIKLSINSPFLCQWQTLLNDWKRNTIKNDVFFVLRDKCILKTLQNMIKTKKTVPDFDWDVNCLVPVKLLTKGKGKLSNFALICLLDKGENLSKKSSELVEQLKADRNQKKRCTLHLEHQTYLKKLRRNRVRSKRKLLENSKNYVVLPKQDNSKMLNKYSSQMKELWLPTQIDSVRRQCSREVMGYVKHGDFSFTEAQSYGVGYVALQSLQLLILNSANNAALVLTRNTTSRQYRYAELEVICDV